MRVLPVVKFTEICLLSKTNKIFLEWKLPKIFLICSDIGSFPLLQITEHNLNRRILLIF